MNGIPPPPLSPSCITGGNNVFSNPNQFNTTFAVSIGGQFCCAVFPVGLHLWWSALFPPFPEECPVQSPPVGTAFSFFGTESSRVKGVGNNVLDPGAAESALPLHLLPCFPLIFTDFFNSSSILLSFPSTVLWKIPGAIVGQNNRLPDMVFVPA